MSYIKAIEDCEKKRDNIDNLIYRGMESYPELTWNKFWGIIFNVLAENNIIVPNTI